MKLLYHHRTQAEDGQAVHIRSMQQAFRTIGCEVHELALVQRTAAAKPATPARAWNWMSLVPNFVRELAEYQYSSWARPRIERAVRAEGIDFIYERYAFGNSGGVAAARATGVPLVLEVNSPMVLELSKTRGLSFPARARRVEQRIFQSADRVCVVTQVLAEMLVEMGVARERLFVTHNGVHLEHYCWTDRPAARQAAYAGLELPEALRGRLLFGFVGYYRDWHRLDLVLDALASPQLRDAGLVLVGEGPAHEGLVARARQLNVEARVHFAGPRPHAAIANLLPAFDVALVPAINPYASPLKLFEYMAAGLPTIAPDQPNLREVLTDGHEALLVPPNDAEALHHALARLATDAELRSRLGNAARAAIVARDLTWEGNARRVLEAVRPLLVRMAGQRPSA